MYATSRKSVKAGATVIGALAIVGVLASSSNAAATTYTVAVGTKTTGTATLSGATTGSLTFKDITTGLNAICSSSTAAGAATLSKTHAAAKVATITSSKFVGCKANGQLDLAVTQVGTWTLNAVGKTVSGKTAATLSTIKANVKDTDGFGCSFTIGGTVDAAYANTGVLSFAPKTHDLVISNQKGNCLGLANNSDKVSFTGAFNIKSTAPVGKLSITSN